MRPIDSPVARCGEDARRRGLITADDWLQSLDAAAKTAAVIGLVLLTYCLGHGLGELTHYLGELLYAAANGA